MKGKLLFVAGAAVGYVLGARAGRKRYEQIRGAAERIWETPGVQSQVEQVKDFAAQRVGDVPGALADGAKKAFSSLAGTRKNPPKPAAQPAGAKKSGGSGAKKTSSGPKSGSSQSASGDTSSASRSSTTKSAKSAPPDPSA